VVSLAAMLLACAVATAGDGAAATAERHAATNHDAAIAPITLGLFLPATGPAAPIGDDVSRGAAIAVRRANEAGGIDGRSIRLVTADSDRLWDGASGELVRLIYDEGAAAIIGAVDGRSAHLAEQVITRARGAALFMTPWASETTLTRIRVPWFFRMVPDDRQQAEVLAHEMFATRGLRRVAVWVGGEYDGRAAAAEFHRVAPAGAVKAFTADLPGGLSALTERVASGDIDAVVLFAGPDAAVNVVAALRATGTVPPLYGPLALRQPRLLDATAATGAAITLIAPAEVAAERFDFERQYREEHGAAPALPALYGHDAAAALIEALRAAGTENGDRLAASLSCLSFQGVTGEVSFNDQGGRDMMPVLATARRGTPAARRAGDGPTGR
jgi:branched-chain amino acid transport system substrate-binding protein